MVHQRCQFQTAEDMCDHLCLISAQSICWTLSDGNCVSIMSLNSNLNVTLLCLSRLLSQCCMHRCCCEGTWRTVDMPLMIDDVCCGSASGTEPEELSCLMCVAP
jgi:hypothetical protein